MLIGEAKICLDCNHLYEGESCPYCGSTEFWWMSKFSAVKKLALKNCTKETKEE